MAEKKIDDDGTQARPGQQLEGDEQLDRGGRGRRRHRNRPGPGTSINMDELRELIALIRENGLAEFELEHQGFRVRLRREEASRAATDGEREFTPAEAPIEVAAGAVATKSGSVQAKNPAVPVHPGAQAETAASEDQDLHIITSPIVGTFYRSPSPTAESFVRIGSTVEAETVVCIIEAMKLMNEIQAEAAGEVAKIYVENGQPVEYGQPLFGIKQ